VKDGNAMPSIYKIFASSILKSGYVYLMPESRIKKREADGLPSLPKPNLEQVAKLFEATGFSKTLENAKTVDKVDVTGGERVG
jgi:hypothetical protein